MKTIIFDFDGTLALNDHRKHFIHEGEAYKKWFNSLDEAQQVSACVCNTELELIELFKRTTGWIPDYQRYFEAIAGDTPNWPVIHALLMAVGAGHKVVILTGAPQIAEAEIKFWLQKNLIHPDVVHLHVRDNDDFRADPEYKGKWAIENYPNGFEPILCVYDDKQEVVDMWRDMGITCFQVAPN